MRRWAYRMCESTTWPAEEVTKRPSAGSTTNPRFIA